MKRTMIILLSFIMLLASCAKSSEDIYQYIYVNKEVKRDNYKGNISTFSRFNVLTGKTTPLCSDPQCDHTELSSCNFFGARNYKIVDDYIYFTKNSPLDSNPHIMSICSYNIRKDKYKELYSFEFKDIVTDYMGSGYYWCRLNNPDECFRIDLRTGKCEELDLNTPIPVGDFNGTYVYIKDNEIKDKYIIYTADANGMDNNELVTGNIYMKPSVYLLDDGYMFYFDNYEIKNGRINGNFHLLNIVDGTTIPLPDKMSGMNPVIINGFLYYTKYVENPDLMGYRENSDIAVYNIYGGIIWSMDINTRAENKFLEVPEYFFNGITLWSVGEYVVVNYIDVNKWEGKSFNKSTGGRLVMNTTSGEYKVYPM